jgi:hypothetical protein
MRLYRRRARGAGVSRAFEEYRRDDAATFAALESLRTRRPVDLHACTSPS